MKGKFYSPIVLSFLILAFSLSCSSDNSVSELEEETLEEATIDPCEAASGKLYVEKDGLVRVDIVNPSLIDNGWATANTLEGFQGNGYIIWTGQNNFNTPGQGIIKFSIQINTPGTFQFVWNSRIGIGDDRAEHNDSWLRIPTAADFYGEKASTGERVYPRGVNKTPNPEGSSSNGWLKVYMKRVGEWFWRSTTNDNDPYNIFASFDKTGVYDIEISGRSNAHAIDQFVMFKIDLSLLDAQNSAFSEIKCLN